MNAPNPIPCCVYFNRLFRSGFAACVVAGMVIPLPVSADWEIMEVELLRYNIPRKTAFVTAKGSSDSCPGIFVLLHAEDTSGKRVSGLGDILPRGLVTNEIQRDAWVGALAMREALLGKKLADGTPAEGVAEIEKWMEELGGIASKQQLTTKYPPLPHRQLRATLCGFDIALLDLLGNIHGVSIADLLAEEPSAEITLSAATLGADIDAEELRRRLGTMPEAYRAVRMKVGADDEADLVKLDILARALVAEGRGREIFVDVNQAWKDAGKSLEMLSKIREILREAEFKSRFICEQPTYQHDWPAMAEVTRETRAWNEEEPFQFVVMADESLWDSRDAAEMLDHDAADAVNIKIQKAGGLLESMRIARLLNERAPGVEVYVGGLIMTDIGAAANLQLCRALPRLDYVTGALPRGSAFPVQPATERLRYSSGRTLRTPTQPGLGTGLDVEAIEEFVGNRMPASP